MEAAWGRLKVTDKAEKARRLAGIVGPPELFARPGRSFNRAKGKALFEARCSRGHTLFGEGRAIGPDLTGAERRNIDVLMQNIVDPSASIRKE